MVSALTRPTNCELNLYIGIPSTSTRSAEWKQLRTLTLMGLELRGTADVERMAGFFRGVNPSCLEDVTIQYLVTDPRIIQLKGESYYGLTYGTNPRYIRSCLKLEDALLKYPPKRLSFILCITPFSRRKQLWTHELGQLFPELRERNQLTVTSLSSELELHSPHGIANQLFSYHCWS